MRLSLHTIICCCVFTTVMSQTKGDPEEPNSLNNSFMCRFKKWLQNNTSEPDNRLLTTTEPNSDISVEESQKEEGETPTVPPRCKVSLRFKRSPSEAPGCFLITCTIHDLIAQLHMIQQKTQLVCAPQKKMGIDGFGRRRRSLTDLARLALQTAIKEAGRQL